MADATLDSGSRGIVRAGALSGLALGVVQLAGIVMHGSIPPGNAAGLHFVHQHPVWLLTHYLLIGSYFLVVGFYVGLGASISEHRAVVALGGNLALVGAVLGAVHFTIHLTIFYHVAQHHHHGGGAAEIARLEMLYDVMYRYAHWMNRASGLCLMAVGVLFGSALTRSSLYPRALGWFGAIASAVTFLSLVVAELFLSRRGGDLTFAVALLPTIAWIVWTCIRMLKLKVPAVRNA
jgi:hypothetical protein